MMCIGFPFPILSDNKCFRIKDCSKRDKHLGHVNFETSAEKMCDIYNNWAPSFNQDIEDEVKYVGHLLIAEFLGNHIESSMRPGQKVIDVGAGTGLVDLVLYENV